MTSRIIPCPYCRNETKWNDNPHRPFCSERCRLIDLGNWSDGSYCIPTTSTASVDNVIPFPQLDTEEEH